MNLLHSELHTELHLEPRQQSSGTSDPDIGVSTVSSRPALGDGLERCTCGQETSRSAPPSLWSSDGGVLLHPLSSGQKAPPSAGAITSCMNDSPVSVGCK